MQRDFVAKGEIERATGVEEIAGRSNGCNYCSSDPDDVDFVASIPNLKYFMLFFSLATDICHNEIRRIKVGIHFYFAKWI